MKCFRITPELKSENNFNIYEIIEWLWDQDIKFIIDHHDSGILYLYMREKDAAHLRLKYGLEPFERDK